MWLGKLGSFCVIPALLWAWTSGAAGARQGVEETPPPSLTDDRGHHVRLSHFSRRIISLSPSITELVYAAGAGDKLVGADLYSDYPDAVKSIPRIGDASSLDLERIVALEPDLVIAWRSGSAAVDIRRLERLGMNVAATEASRLEDVPRLLRLIGQWAGTSTQAESAARAYENELRTIRDSYAGREKVRMVQLIWRHPLMTVNGNHIISDIISICGGVNMFASAPALTPVIGMENLLEVRPRAIVSSISPRFDGREIRLDGWIRGSAMEGSDVIFIHPDLIHRQTPRILQAARKVCEELDKVRFATRSGIDPM
ncbi:MAG: cobalamin-binding protein [Nitrosospira sp.]|jgi:iron complex transport system substrate-binding protein|nr:cobalamin-binding protein [Nitrosospira sp.]